MNQLEQAARQALDVLEMVGYYMRKEEVITALREALEQPQKTNQCGEVCERAKLCATCAQGLKPDQASEPVAWIADWSVFNTGAEVASGLSLNDAMDYLTDERATREWSVVCVINKDNMPTPATPQPARQPLTGKQLLAVLTSCPHDTAGALSAQWLHAVEFARAIERAHRIGEAAE